MTALAQFFSLHRKYLLFNLLMRNLKVRYRKSFFGFLWTMIVPTMMTVVYYFVFKYIARMGGDNYPLFLLTGIIPWTFFATALTSGTESLVNNFGILSKVPISISAFPLSDTVSAFVNLILSLPVLLGLALFYEVYPMIGWIQVPALLGVLFLVAYPIAFLMSVAYVYLRDVRHLVGIFVQVWMYLTPILYSSDRIPEEYRKWFWLNPLYAIFDSLHISILRGEWISLQAWENMALWIILLMSLALFVHLRVQYRIVEKL